MLTSETTIVPRPVECTSTCTVVPECDTVTVRSPPAFTYVLKLGPHLLGIMKSYLTEAPPLSLEQFSVAVPSSFDRLTEQSPDTDFAAYFAPMWVFVTWQVASAAAGSTSEATIRMRGRSRFMSGWRRGIGNTAHSVIPPGRPPLFPNTGDPRITSYLTMMCRRGSEAAPCIHATSPAHTRHPPRGHRRDCRGDPDAGRVRRVGRAHTPPPPRGPLAVFAGVTLPRAGSAGGPAPTTYQPATTGRRLPPVNDAARAPRHATAQKNLAARRYQLRNDPVHIQEYDQA